MVRLGLVVAQFDKVGGLIDEMADRAREAAAARDAEVVATATVPGSYDTPLAADRLARRDDVDAVAVLGAIVTGDTDHDQVIADAAAQGLTDVSLRRDTPVTLGVIGPGMSTDEARARTDYGATAVDSAVDLATGLPATAGETDAVGDTTGTGPADGTTDTETDGGPNADTGATGDPDAETRRDSDPSAEADGGPNADGRPAGPGTVRDSENDTDDRP